MSPMSSVKKERLKKPLSDFSLAAKQPQMCLLAMSEMDQLVLSTYHTLLLWLSFKMDAHLSRQRRIQSYLFWNARNVGEIRSFLYVFLLSLLLHVQSQKTSCKRWNPIAFLFGSLWKKNESCFISRVRQNGQWLKDFCEVFKMSPFIRPLNLTYSACQYLKTRKFKIYLGDRSFTLSRSPPHFMPIANWGKF